MNILITKTHITLAKSSTRAIQKTRESKDPPVYPILTSQRKFYCKYVFFPLVQILHKKSEKTFRPLALYRV